MTDLQRVSAEGPPPRTWGWRTAVRWMMSFGAFCAVVWILMRSGSALTPFIIGLVLAYLMVPLVGRLERRMPRWAAILIVYLMTFGVIGLIIAYIVPPTIGQIEQLASNVPTWYQDARTQVETLFARFQREVSPEIQAQVDEQVANIQQTLKDNASAWAQNAATFLFSGVQTIFQTLTFLLGFLIIPFFLFYTLLDARQLPNTLNAMMHPRIRSDVWNVLKIVDTIFGKYIRGQLVLGVIIATMSFIGLHILGWLGYEVRYTLLLAIIAGFGELVPVIGPILTAIPAIIVGATDSWQTAIGVAVLYIVIQQVENQVLVPRIVGNNLRLHAALLMALLVIASQIGGILLVILSAPLTAIARDIFVYLHQRLMEPPIPATVAITNVLEPGIDTKETRAKQRGNSRTYPLHEAQEAKNDAKVAPVSPASGRKRSRSRLT